MSEEPRMLVCDVRGEALRIPASVVQRITLRLPVVRGPHGDVVSLGDQSWSVQDERPGDPAMNDHFVFLDEGDGPRVVVVDRVLGLEPDVDLGAGGRGS